MTFRQNCPCAHVSFWYDEARLAKPDPDLGNDGLTGTTVSSTNLISRLLRALEQSWHRFWWPEDHPDLDKGWSLEFEAPLFSKVELLLAGGLPRSLLPRREQQQTKV